jgi:cyclohexyl-isocyanide hydratase
MTYREESIMNRRTLNKALASTVALAALQRLQAEQAQAQAQADTATPAPQATVAMLLYPELTVLDLIGPQLPLAFLPGRSTQLVWKTRETVVSDTGVPIQPTMTFDEVPEEVEMLFIPGGVTGTVTAMQDPEVLDFVASRGAKATYVTSVCTGSLILGAAGLLDGYQATSHWAYRDLLSFFGAEPVDERVVIDRNRITGGGVTAGIDFGLTLLAHLADDAYAMSTQLIMEYDPEPPFQSGTPEQAAPEIVAQANDFLAPFVEAARAASEHFPGVAAG